MRGSNVSARISGAALRVPGFFISVRLHRKQRDPPLADCKASARRLGVECRLLRYLPRLPRGPSRLMNKPPRKKNPTFGIAVFIVVAVLFVIATLFYNAIKEKREFDNDNAPAASVSSGAAAATATATSAAATAAKPASGTAQ
jgi:hypothetical protein